MSPGLFTRDCIPERHRGFNGGGGGAGKRTTTTTGRQADGKRRGGGKHPANITTQQTDAC